MQPTPSKRARFNTPLVSPPAATSSNYSSHHSSQFLSSPPLPLPYKKSSALGQPFLHAPKLYQPRPSSPIGSEGASHLFFAACRRAEEENEAKTGIIPEEESEVDANESYLYSSSENSSLEIDSSSSSSEDDDDDQDHWEDVAPGFQKQTRSSWIDAGSSSYAKEKLVKILAGDLPIPKQRWSLRRILATLVHHRKDQRLRSAFRQFCHFAYQTMMTESERNGRWPGSLAKKDCNLIIRLRFRREMESRYGREVQKLCKSSGFGMIKNLESGTLDREPLETIVSQAKETAPLLTSLVLSVGPTTFSTPHTSHVASMKLVAILVIMCRSAHRNNSNYIPLLIAMYLYSAGARIDAITLLNHLGISVSYSVLMRKLRNITTSSVAFIKEQASNNRLVGTWDNFEYRENVAGERIGDIVKFRSVTMALWIKAGWRIPAAGLKQWMWNAKRDMIDPQELITKVYGPQGTDIRQQCIRSHRFQAFLAAFPGECLSSSASMPVIDRINCKLEGKTEAYAFAPSMFSESSLAGNQSVFEDLNVTQLGIDKTDARWNELLTIWWGDQKTEVQMLGMQANGIRMDRPYDQYQHMFPGLALWHLRFNYLKMIWELFYPGGSATERSTLQWAADHWHRDKTTRPTDFHSLEDLTLHSYRARIIAIMKQWVEQCHPTFRLHDNKALGTWFSEMTPEKWKESMDWLDDRMDQEATKPEENWNDHWNNHARFCRIVEPYMTLCYAIKNGDTGLLKHALREVCIIFQSPVVGKPKYARAMLRQLHIFDTKAADPVLQEAYLANSLVNPKGQPRTFYEMDLLLEHQNGEFKRFRTDRGSSLQETDDMFRLHALSVDTLKKVRSSMNRIIIGRVRDGYHPQKDSSFDILSLADQLHRSKSTYLEGPERGKIYFSENQVPDLIKLGLEYLPRNVKAYKKAVWKNSAHNEAAEADTVNESVEELFRQARDDSAITSELFDAE